MINKWKKSSRKTYFIKPLYFKKSQFTQLLLIKYFIKNIFNCQ